MAFAREVVRGGGSANGLKKILARSGKLVAWVAIPGAGVALALWSLATVAGAYSAATSIRANAHFMPVRASTAMVDPRGGEAASKLKQALVAREWAKFRRQAEAEKLAMAEKAKTAAAAALVANAPLGERFAATASISATPDADRFGSQLAEPERAARVALALSGPSNVELGFAEPSPTPDAAVRDVLVASLVLPDQQDDSGDQEIALADPGQTDAPAFAAVPDSGPLPVYRPRAEERPKAEEKPRRAEATPQPVTPPAPKPKRITQPSQPVLAYARPDNPAESGGLGQAFRNLFSSPGSSARAGNGTAVYDIASATVNMPDGSRLEAHSGIGEMADNVRYVNQKMRGPTPPDTYNLSMRESLFHGVEAIRLTPTDGKTKHGRTGLLAHSYLLRGGRAQSHGCVAFKDYKRFLAAFKQGKIKRLVVVGGSSRGKAATVADNGRGV